MHTNECSFYRSKFCNCGDAEMKKWKGLRIRVKKEFKSESHLKGLAIGEPMRANVEDWLPVLWDGQEDPDFFKLAGIEEDSAADMQKLTNPDFSKLEKTVDSYFKFVKSDDYNDDEAGDYRNYIFEAAVEAFFGDKFWEIIRNR